MPGNHDDTIIRQFSLQARAFAACPAHADDRSLSIFMTLGQFQPNDRLLDAGCGPGIVTRYLARHVAHVTGVDLTPAMLELARRSAAEASIANVTFIDGDMTDVPAPDAAFDGVVTRYAFHHLASPGAAMRELVRVTRPGGAIVLLDAAPEAARREAYDAFERARDPSHTTALTIEELLSLGEAHDLGPAVVERFRLPMAASALLEHAYPEAATKEELWRLLRDDVRRDVLGFAAKHDRDDLAISFPLAAVGWRRPG